MRGLKVEESAYCHCPRQHDVSLEVHVAMILAVAAC